MDTTAETLVRGYDDEELALSGLFGRGVVEDLCSTGQWLLKSLSASVPSPELAIPYSFPACIARCAFASFVEAIIFMDYATVRKTECTGYGELLRHLLDNQVPKAHTFVIFSMFLTDFNRNSISRRVAMFLAPAGAAPSTFGCEATRPSVLLASIS